MPRIGSGIALVGRQDELARLRAALATAAAGQAGAVLIGGDAGVGKTRLLTEFVAAARSGGTTVFTGRCLDVDEAGLPYLPFVEALGQLTPAQRTVAARRAVLSRLMPGVAPAEESNEPAMEQLRLFDGVHGLFSDLAAETPVLLAIEDLHWADASTRDLILFLVSRLYTQRILIVGTYRLDDLHRRHPLRPLLGELSRLSTVELMELGPFDQAHAMKLVDALSDGTLPSATVQKIAKRSEGNAFFCEELTAAYGDGAGVPAGLADLLLARIERLSGDARKVVRAAAVASQRVTHESLRTVSSLPDDVLEEALRETVQHNVLVAADGGYTFRHALLREAVYDDLLPGERVRLHAGYAQVVTSNALLAYHSLRSHDLPGALVASVKAADEAGKMGALGEKLRHVEQALELWRAVPDPERLTGRTELGMVRAAARASIASGEVERAEEYSRAAVALADELDDPELRAETRHQLAFALIALEDRGSEIQKTVDEAWDLVRDRPAGQTRAKVLALAARSWVWSWQIDLAEVKSLAEQALRDAREVGATAVEVDALVTRAVFAEWEGDVAESIRMGAAAAERAASIGAYDVELRARKNNAVTLWIHGDKTNALRMMDFIAERSVEVGLPWNLSGIDARLERVVMRYANGDWAGALAAGQDTAGAPTVARARVLAPTLWVLAASGDFAALDERAESLTAQTEDVLTREIVNLGQAEAALWRGRPRQAVDHIDTLISHMETMSRGSVTDAMMATSISLWALCDIAEDARRRSDQAAAAATVAEGEALVERVSAIMPIRATGRRGIDESHPEVIAFRARVQAELSRLRGHHDVRLWEEATGPAILVEYWRAVARWRWASLLLADGSRDRAAELLVAAYEVADRLGARPLRAAVTDLARRSRISLPGRQPAAEPISDLTPRELAVLKLVASGLTNRQVGERLYISQKTASVHLSRAMAKLGAANRTEVVSIAHERGLIGDLRP
ncbi:helix-turn-helix transcriptional regulator [Kibdelosporangium persicum]|uniref:helix-turn-helix transcriptional regulator n=1 Tax=Kibdelosporangium persicum TaxID=2698649 RepID=UPI001566AC35|nr:helix-turn-helix transcriptional regulator [Kibdelosporangium persicum]